MPAPNPVTPAQVLAWLQSHPGKHNAVVIGNALGCSSQTAQRRLKRLVVDGFVTRHGGSRGPSVAWEVVA